MNISNAADFDFTPIVPHRPGEARSKRLIETSGYLKAVKVGVSRVLGEKTTPRHRHDFDQFRIGLRGVLDFGRGQKVVPRTIMYVPAGTWYGPESWHGPGTDDETLISLVQFDGECQAGMLSPIEIDAATEELKRSGVFQGGFYYPNELGERKAIDGYQASWEHATGKKLVYPPAFVDEPIYMHIDAMPWTASPEAGIEVKTLGAFGNHGLRLGMSKLARGANRALFNTRQRLVAFCLTGEARVNGTPFALHSALLLEPGETAIATGFAEATELVEIALPNFDERSAAAGNDR